jgi:hypothetical protein
MRKLQMCCDRCQPCRPHAPDDPCVDRTPRISKPRFDATEGYLHTQEGRRADDLAPLTCILSHRHCLDCSFEFGL